MNAYFIISLWVKEVFVDPTRDESLIFELLEFKPDVGNDGSATWFLQDLATEQDAEGCTVILTSRFYSVNCMVNLFQTSCINVNVAMKLMVWLKIFLAIANYFVVSCPCFNYISVLV